MTKRTVIEKINDVKEKIASLNNDLEKLFKALEIAEDPGSMDVFVLLYDKEVCGVFDTEIKAEKGKNKHMEKHEEWKNKYDNYVIQKYDISKPKDNKIYCVFCVYDCHFYSVRGWLDEACEECNDLHFEADIADLILNEIQ